MPRRDRELCRRRRHLEETIRFISEDRLFNELSPERYEGLRPNRAGYLREACSHLRSTPSGEVSIPQFEIPVQDKKLRGHRPRLVVGGLVELSSSALIRSSFSFCITFRTSSGHVATYARSEGSSELNTQSCCLGTCTDRVRVVRRFHFDWSPEPTAGPAGLCPSHLQYGGLFPGGDGFDDWHYCVEHFLELPRIMYPPMDLALVLDLGLRQFETPLARWKEEQRWRSLVLDSEELWWQDYWRRGADHLGLSVRQGLHEIVLDKL